MGELANLIEAASRANHGRSYQAAADIAARKGVHISKSLIGKNARRVVSLTPLLVQGIAAGYGVSQEDVIRAALKDMGFTISDYTVSPESAIRRDPSLSSEARGMLLAALDAARSSHRVQPFAGAGSRWDVPGVDPDPTDGPGVGGNQNGYERDQLGS